MRILPFFFLPLATGPTVSAQSGLSLPTIPLESLSSFDNPGENWILADSVYSDLTIHHSLVVTPGTGVLVNQPSENTRTNLYTNWTHGDIELEMEFMMPPGSNSGIYLQGRYEIQLLDSWKRPHVTFGDVGGIYQRWDESEERGFEGRRPRINASRAPGLWQSLRIVFDAPKFDEHGHKVQNARFAQVILNGSIVQENVSVSGPTRSAGFEDEASYGPLMIQGDHGPVAFRNIRYRATGKESVSAHNITYHEYTDGSLDEVIWNHTGTPTSTGSVDNLQDHVVTSSDPIAIRYEGQLRIPAGGTYRFNATLGWISGDPHWTDRSIGGALLKVANQEVLRHDRNQPSVYSDVSLDEGIYPFSFGYFKAVGWRPPQVTLSIEGPSTRPDFLLLPRQRPAPDERILVMPGTEPLLLRGFITHQGSKRTHTIAVGNPEKIHYSLDLSTAALLHAWRGPFVDTAPMWHNRGHEQTILPLGSVLTFSGHSAIETESSRSLRFIGYQLVPHPVFTYSIGEAVLEDHIQPQSDASGLSRTLVFTGNIDETIWVRIAVSDQISALDNHRYAIDGFTWYVETDSNASVHQTQDGDALVIPLEQGSSNASARYVIVW